ncbi:MAG: hypothetical protein C4527_24340, partial [Candidatus Omnitrophota bacterium]
MYQTVRKKRISKESTFTVVRGESASLEAKLEYEFDLGVMMKLIFCRVIVFLRLYEFLLFFPCLKNPLSVMQGKWILGLGLGCLLCVSLAAQAAVPYSLAPAAANRYPQENESTLFNPERNEYVLSYQDKDFALQYTFRTIDPVIQKGLIHTRAAVDEKYRILPINQGGLYVRSATGVTIPPAQMAEQSDCTLVSHALEGNTIRLLYHETIDGATYQKQYSYRLCGKTLILRVTADAVADATSGYVGFDFGHSRFTLAPKIFILPNSPIPIVRTGKDFFLSTYVDPVLSNTGRYAQTIREVDTRTVQASNTPAWLLQVKDGRIPALDITAYITISKLMTDVVPSPTVSLNSHADEMKKRIVVALNELPLASHPIQPVAIARRWESPASGLVDLRGTFALEGEGKANCEVRLFSVNDEKSHILFSQELDSFSKPSTGIEGAFPLAEGDQLSFLCSGPAVVNGGVILLRVQIDQNGKHFDSFYDFSDIQGHRGWHYEQILDQNTSLLLWNPKQNQWESTMTRSFQSADRIVCRSGRPGDAFAAAEYFFDEIRAMGLTGLHYILEGWSDHARITLLPEDNRSDRVWGSVTTLKRLTEKEIKEGNIFSDTISLDPDLSAINQDGSETVSQKMVFEEDYVHYVQEKIKNDQMKMAFNTLTLRDFPSPDYSDRLLIPTQVGSFFERSSRAATRRAHNILNPILNLFGNPVLLWHNRTMKEMDFFLSSFSSGVLSPPNPKS